MPQNNELKLIISAEVDKYLSALNKAESQTNSFGDKAKSALSSIGIDPKALGLAAVTAAIIAGGKAALGTAARFEQYSISLEVMLGSADRAKSLLGDLQNFANVTPFNTEGLLQNTKLLLSFGASANEILPTLQMLGDVSGGDQQKLDSLTLAFAQMSATGRLMGQDLLQMVNAGFNPLQEISKKTGKSMGELKDQMEKGAISSSMVRDAFKAATSEGGRFFGMMDKQSGSLTGRLSTLGDAWTLVSKNIGDIFMPIAKGTVDLLISITTAAKDAIGILSQNVKIMTGTETQSDKIKTAYVNQEKATADLLSKIEELNKKQNKQVSDELQLKESKEKLISIYPKYADKIQELIDKKTSLLKITELLAKANRQEALEAEKANIAETKKQLSQAQKELANIKKENISASSQQFVYEGGAEGIPTQTKMNEPQKQALKGMIQTESQIKKLEASIKKSNENIKLLNNPLGDYLDKKGGDNGTNTDSTKTSSTKKATTVKIDKETIGYGDYTTKFSQRLQEESKNIDEEKNLLYKSYQVKAELRKLGLKDTDRVFNEELTLEIDHFKRQSDIEQQLTKESQDAIDQIKKKKRDDIINISSGNATNKPEAISAIESEADKQVKAIEKITETKKKQLITQNDYLTTAKKSELAEQRSLQLQEARLQIADQKASSSNEYSIGKEQLSVDAKLLNSPSIEKEKEILIEFDNFKKDLELQEIERMKTRYANDPAELEKIEQNKSDIIKRHTLTREQIEAEADQKKQARMLNFTDDLASGWSNQVGQLINGTLTFQDAFTSTTSVIRNAFANLAMDMTKTWLKEHLTMQAITESTALKEIAINSKSAIVSAIKAVVGIPIVGPALAVGAAVGTAALIASFARRENGGPVTAGTPYIVGEKRQEIFVPNQNGYIRPNTDGFNTGGQQQSGTVAIINNYNIKAWDSQDVKQYLYAHAKDIANIQNSNIKDNVNGARTIIKQSS